MAEKQPAIVLPTQQFLGYWGMDSEAAQDLMVLVERGEKGFDSFEFIQSRSSPKRGNQPQAVWAIVISPTSNKLNELLNPSFSLRPSVVVGASASGFGVNESELDAVVNLGHDRLILQREPFGRFPIYWMRHNQTIWFSSRWQWLAFLTDHSNINLAAVYSYACFSYIPTPLTPLASIANLPAGTQQAWTIDPLQPTISTATQSTLWIWQEATEQITNEGAAIAQLQSLLQQAIQSQIADLPDEPVGVFLSGGLDSSIVAALLVQAGLNVRAYTLNLGETGLPEWPYAEQVANHLNIPLVKVDATPRQIRRGLKPTAQALDLPFGDGVTVPLYLLAAAASQDVSIVFNGEGGDQLFAGWTNKPLIAAETYQAELPQSDSFLRQYLRTFHRLWGYEVDLFQPEVLSQVQLLNPEIWLKDALDVQACPSLLHQLRRATLMLKGAQNIHPRATHIGLAHGLKVRSPFCSLPLAEWAFQLSSELHLRGSCEKYILKRAVENWLPPDIVWRPKRGMGVPLTSWCFNELWSDLGTWLNPAQLAQEGIWQPHIANRIVTGQLGTIQGRRIGECLWLLLMWQVWRRTTLGAPMRTFSLKHPFWLPSPLGQLYCHLTKEKN